MTIQEANKIQHPSASLGWLLEGWSVRGILDHTCQSTAFIRFTVVMTKHLVKRFTDALTWLKFEARAMAACVLITILAVG